MSTLLLSFDPEFGFFRHLTHGDFPTVIQGTAFAFRKGLYPKRNPEAGASWNEQVSTISRDQKHDRAVDPSYDWRSLWSSGPIFVPALSVMVFLLARAGGVRQTSSTRR
jgi:hypothetical protein